MEGFRIDLKTFWAWLCLTNTLKLSESKYQAGFWGPKSFNLHDPYIYSTTVLYDTIVKSCELVHCILGQSQVIKHL